MPKETAISPDIRSACVWPAEPKAARRSVCEYVCYLVEETAWDDKLMQHEKWLDRMCWFGIAVAVLYFLPVLFSICMR